MNSHKGALTLRDLLATSLLEVPAFQRAYAWEENPHLRDFFEDLNAHPPQFGYFLGTFLLTQANGGADTRFRHQSVVDGQQRLTTACIFVSAARARLSVLGGDRELAADCENLFISDAVGRRRKFRTIREDDPFFERFIIGPEEATDADIATPSQRRLWNAKNYFRRVLATCEESTIGRLLSTLLKSQILVYAVNTDVEATQIFELQNDRGKRLTDLEPVKSYLMHGLYLQGHADVQGDLRFVQQDFEAIYRAAEQIEAQPEVPSDDQILQYHCIAFETWVRLEERVEGWRQPKELIKKVVSSEDRRGGLTPPEWIKRCSGRIKDSFTATLQILRARDTVEALGDLTALGRIAPFWPVLLKCWRADRTPGRSRFAEAVRAMERFAFRSVIAGKRSDAGVSDLRVLARDFVGNFDELVKRLGELRNGWGIETDYVQGLNSPNFYDYDHAATYLLWRYENHLRSRQGQQWPRLSWTTLIAPATDAQRFAKDHIEPKDEGNERLKRLAKWNPDDAEERERPFGEIFLHRLGNLVLDSVSAGAAKGAGGFKDRIAHYTSRSELLSQGEVVTLFATVNDGSYEWDETAIRSRHKALVDFAREHW
ncbi:MAG: DUF262 domain-containing protein [Candidatus Rokuibacteriota bacterium]